MATQIEIAANRAMTTMNGTTAIEREQKIFVKDHEALDLFFFDGHL